MRKIIKKKDGFTLLELMIVVSIITVMAAIAVPNFINWAPKFRLWSATDDITKHLMLARMSAISQNRDVVVSFFKNESKYRITHKTGVENYVLPKGILFGSLPITTITFNPTGQADVNLMVQIYSDSPKLIDNKRTISVRAITGMINSAEGW
ncbi:MAG: prepilin-type N-terminal cleavage/methylation domain-containing protein [Deltaproteobacteria bacterium]|nr:prepilin-type N-terminal cleavage/methylation domain-containing protein [Candidatus Zymogenaceae bacterium]